MIKYKNLFFIVILVAFGALSVMSNYNSVTGVSTRKNKLNTKLDSKINYIKKEKILISKVINIKNLNYTLNKSNQSKLNSIMITSEESTYGFKNLYELAAVPNKLMRIKKEVCNFRQKRKREIININNQFINMKLAHVSNELLSYSSNISKIKYKVFSPKSMINWININNRKEIIKAYRILPYKEKHQNISGKLKSWINKNQVNFWIVSPILIPIGIAFYYFSIKGADYLYNKFNAPINSEGPDIADVYFEDNELPNESAVPISREMINVNTLSVSPQESRKIDFQHTRTENSDYSSINPSFEELYTLESNINGAEEGISEEISTIIERESIFII